MRQRLDDDGRAATQHRVRSQSDFFDLTVNRRMDGRRDKGIAVADLLTRLHRLALPDQRLTDRPKMLAEHHRHFRDHRARLDPPVTRQGLLLRWMNPAGK